ncbi:MAG TPA: NAD(P)-dependent oxidoreductase [Nitriliruptorales bacterium]
MRRLAILSPLPAESVSGRFDDIDVRAVLDIGDPIETCRGADIVIADFSGTHRVTPEIVEVIADTCRLVQVPAAGLDSVDVEACAAAGVPVASCAGLNAAGVAEWCVWATISALRRTSEADRGLREGRFEQLGVPRYELRGKTVGLIGMGDIGVACAPRFAAFDVDLRYWTRTRRAPEREVELGVTWSQLDDLFRQADVIVLAIALSAATRNLVDADRLATVKPSAVIVNAARGEVWDEHAVAGALRAGQLHGAATDVFSQEPPPADHPLLDIEAIALTPHIAGSTAEAVGAIFGRVLDNVGRVLRGEQPEGLIT